MAAKKVLLVDDEQHIADVVIYILEEDAFQVVTALDGTTGLQAFKRHEPDLVILDLTLPGISGLDLFRHMRRLRPNVPVIMLTSRSEEIDRVLGLELGADDYVTKPFSPRELAARVKSVLRRAAPAEGERVVRAVSHGPIEIDSATYSLTYFGTQLALTRAEFKLMESLVRYPAQVFTRDVLVAKLYDDEHVVADRSIDAYVKRLRKKFAEVKAGVNPVETVHGLGYKLNQDIEA